MRWRLLGAFALIILITLGVVALIARYATQQEVQTFLGHGGQVGLEKLANSLESYYDQNGSWSGVDSVSGGNVNAGPGNPGRGQGQRGANPEMNPGGNGPNVGNANNHIVTDADRKVVYSPNPEEIGSILPESEVLGAIPLEVDGGRVGYLLPEGGIPALPADFEVLLIERVNRASLLAAMISGAVAIPLALILATLILRPVRGLTRAAEQLAMGDFNQRVDAHGTGELAVLGKTFNQMADSLQDSVARRQTMTADIAHELRNPLAIQRAHLEALQDGIFPLTPENLAMVAEQNQQLSRLVDDLRTLALADAGELSLTCQPLDFGLLGGETAARFVPQAEARHINLQVIEPEQRVWIEGDQKRLQQVLDNLMQNALRYTPLEGQIVIKIQSQGDQAMLSIYNDGPSIAPDALEHLFERFYRGDRARDRASGGTGLGLAIARQLVESHGGALKGENYPEGGVLFTLTLPALADPAAG